MREVIESFSSDYSDIFYAKGVPIGNLTSQLFANIYLNEFDQFVKNKLRIKNYARYTDDFVIVSNSKKNLQDILQPIGMFLKENLAVLMFISENTVQ